MRAPFAVHVNAVAQREGVDYRVEDGMLVFDRELVKADRLGLWRWFLGAWGIGDYRRNDQIDVSWDDASGRPRMAHALDIEPAGPAGATPPRSSTAPSS